MTGMAGPTAAAQAGRGTEGHAFRAPDSGHERPSAVVQASYLNDLGLARQLEMGMGLNISNPEARAMLDNGPQIFDPNKMLRDADNWMKSPQAGAAAEFAAASSVLKGFADLGRGFADAQSDQTSPDEYARLDDERQRQQALEEQQRQQQSA